MADQYIHYVKRKIITRYPADIKSFWYVELQAYDEAFEYPAYHVTRSTSWPATDIKKGDIIWLVGQLASSWGTLKPSIDAKIIVESIEILEDEEGNKKHRYKASCNSKWFPLHDASGLFSKLQTLSMKGDISIPCNADATNVGQAFQSIRKIHNIEDIELFSAKICAKPYDFISYRIVDGTKKAFAKADILIKEGYTVFWDRWSLPRRLAERRELVADSALDNLLNKKILNALNVWGIESPKYSESGSYSEKEKILATSLGKYNPIKTSKSKKS